MDYSTINANYARSIQTRADAMIQDEIIAAKQIQAQTQCTWTEALKAAVSLLRADRAHNPV